MTSRHRVATDLRDRIADGTYLPGRMLPSEERLAREFGVSRPTVRAAVAELRAAGQVEVYPGRGMLVRDPRARPPHTVAGGGSDHRWVGVGEPESGTVPAPGEVARLLALPPGARVRYRQAVQQAPHGVRRLHVLWTPAGACLGEVSLHAHGQEVREHVRTRLPLPDEAEALGMREGVPLLHVARVTVDDGERPVVLEDVRMSGAEVEVAYRLGESAS